MVGTRIKSYYKEQLVGDVLFPCDNQTMALDKYRRYHPEMKDCILVAESYDTDAPENKEHLQAFIKCGCIE